MTVGLGDGAQYLGPALEAIIKVLCVSLTPQDPKQINNSPKMIPAGTSGKGHKETQRPIRRPLHCH